MKKTLTLLLSTFLAAGALHAGDRLNNEQLQALYTNKTFVGNNAKWGAVRSYFGGDGEVHSIAASGKERVGKWWIDGDKRCLRWNNKNKDFCHYTEKNSDGTISLIHGGNGKELVVYNETLDGNQL